MDKNNENNIGCGKALLYVSAGILVLVVIVGALEGISNIFAQIPWYGYLVLSIGFMFILSKLSGD
jgi:hypothetical protein